MNLASFLQILLVFKFIVIVCSENLEETSTTNFCGGIFEENQNYIRSPNYPGKHPANLVCYYQIRSAECTKYFRIKFLDFSLENSENCSASGLEIENEGILCGERNGSKIYFGNNGTLNLKFRSNNTTSGKGFNLLISRIPCKNAKIENETNSKIKEVENYNRSISTHKKMCCSNTLNSKNILITSPNFPQSLSQQDECTYEIRKANNNICKLNLHFLYFWFGKIGSNNCSYGYLEIDGKKFCGCNTDLRLSTTFDSNGIKRISLKTFEGDVFNDSETGFIIQATQEECIEKQSRIIWPENNIGALIQKGYLLKERAEIWNQDWSSTTKPVIQRNFYYFGEPATKHIPFFPETFDEGSYKDLKSFGRIISNSEKSGCKHKITSNLIDKLISSAGFCQRVEKSENLLAFKKLFNNYAHNRCLELGYLSGYFRSPWYPFFYTSNLNQCYRFKKQPSICWLRIFFKDFHVEDSFNCNKDFLKIGNATKYCGASLHQRTVTLDMRDKYHEDIRFVTDKYYCGRGFYALFEQIPCRDNDHTFKPDDEIPTSTKIPSTTPNATCDRIIQDKYFKIEIDRSFETCSLKIKRFSDNICKLNLFFQTFNLSCTTDFLVVNGMRFCGYLSGRQVSINFNENPVIEIVYRGSSEIFDGATILIQGEQSEQDCAGTPPAERLFLAPTTEQAELTTETLTHNHQQYMVKIARNKLKDICMILRYRNGRNQDINLCDIFIKKYNATHCVPIDINHNFPEKLQSETQKMELLFEKNTEVEKLAYQELDCDYVPSY